jgi:undecaprenyl diphosphate synthase
VNRSSPKVAPLPDGLSQARLPRAVAVIMDGNGRWAEDRKLLRVEGHKRGAESVRTVTRECARLGIKDLTLYAFSTENWSRPSHEIKVLMSLLRRYLIDERREIMDNGIVFRAIGQLDRLPANVQREYEKTRDMSAENGGMTLRLALSYGARQEIFEAAKAMSRLALSDPKRFDSLTPDDFRLFLYDPEMPDPDLLIRTSREQRLSNFLLWQLSYTEIYVSDWHWPDFREAQLHEALRNYAQRERRFGGLIERGTANSSAPKAPPTAHAGKGPGKASKP